MDFNISLVFKNNNNNNNTHMDEWVYPIIVENIYHNEVKDFPIVVKIFSCIIFEVNVL